MNEALNIARKLKDALDVAFGHPAHAVIMEPVHESEPAHVDIGPYMTADGQTVIVADCYGDGKIGIVKAHPAAVYGDDYFVTVGSVADATACILAVLKPSEAPTKAKEEIEPTKEQREVAEAFVVARLLSDDDDIPPLARLLAEREHKLQERIDHLEGERDLMHVDIYEHLLHKAPNMGVALHIDGTAQELVGDVIAWVDNAAAALAGRDVVSLQTFRRVEEERNAATKRAEEQEAKLKRAIDIIVSEELDRDFGEPPTTRNLEVRALLTECGHQPERCSRGAIVGYSGTMAEDGPQVIVSGCIDEAING